MPADERRARELLRSAEDLVLHRSPNRLDQGLSWTEEAIRLRPRWAEAYRHRAFLKMQLGRDDDAIADLSLALTYGLDDSSLTLQWRGELRCRQGDLDGGIADLTSAIAVNLLPQRFDRNSLSSLATAYGERAWAWYAKGDLVQALVDASAALAFDPRQVRSLVCRATIWGDLGRFAYAGRDLGLALGVSPENYTALHQLARVWFELGDYPAAARHAFSALTFAKRDGASEETIKTIEQSFQLAKGKLEEGAW